MRTKKEKEAEYKVTYFLELLTKPNVSQIYSLCLSVFHYLCSRDLVFIQKFVDQMDLGAFVQMMIGRINSCKEYHIERKLCVPCI